MHKNRKLSTWEGINSPQYMLFLPDGMRGSSTNDSASLLSFSASVQQVLALGRQVTADSRNLWMSVELLSIALIMCCRFRFSPSPQLQMQCSTKKVWTWVRCIAMSACADYNCESDHCHEQGGQAKHMEWLWNPKNKWLKTKMIGATPGRIENLHLNCD